MTFQSEDMSNWWRDKLCLMTCQTILDDVSNWRRCVKLFWMTFQTDDVTNCVEWRAKLCSITFQTNDLSNYVRWRVKLRACQTVLDDMSNYARWRVKLMTCETDDVSNCEFGWRVRLCWMTCPTMLDDVSIWWCIKLWLTTARHFKLMPCQTDDVSNCEGWRVKLTGDVCQWATQWTMTCQSWMRQNRRTCRSATGGSHAQEYSCWSTHTG